MATEQTAAVGGILAESSQSPVPAGKVTVFCAGSRIPVDFRETVATRHLQTGVKHEIAFAWKREPDTSQSSRRVADENES